MCSKIHRARFYLCQADAVFQIMCNYSNKIVQQWINYIFKSSINIKLNTFTVYNFALACMSSLRVIILKGSDFGRVDFI